MLIPSQTTRNDPQTVAKWVESDHIRLEVDSNVSRRQVRDGRAAAARASWASRRARRRVRTAWRTWVRAAGRCVAAACAFHARRRAFQIDDHLDGRLLLLRVLTPDVLSGVRRLV